jgi:hypothetical protein
MTKYESIEGPSRSLSDFTCVTCSRETTSSILHHFNGYPRLCFKVNVEIVPLNIPASSEVTIRKHCPS